MHVQRGNWFDRVRICILFNLPFKGASKTKVDIGFGYRDGKGGILSM